MKKAVVLLSGGLDSTTVLAIARYEGYEAYCLTVDYGQRHQLELERSKEIAKLLGAREHRTVKLDLRMIGGSALTDSIDVPKSRSEAEMGTGIPVTYVPARNTIMLSLALGYAEVLGAFDIFIGVNALDYSGYPDCRPAFIEAFENLAQVATKAGVEGEGSFRIYAPLMYLTKKDIIRKATSFGIDLGITTSCYDPHDQGLACGQCDACILRKKGFEEAGIPDPTKYRAGP
jgi:7-cyano-7-deazaguanine synthase